jgi:hypothetical protein
MFMIIIHEIMLFHIDDSIDDSIWSGNDGIFVTALSMKDRILIVFLSASRIASFSSHENFRLSIDNFFNI